MAAAFAGTSSVGAPHEAQVTAGPFVADASRQIPLKESTDVVVCGAGPAGVTAAIAAARNGARTRLIEVNGCLGGVWTAGLLTVVHDFANKRGLLAEYIRRLTGQRSSMSYGRVWAYRPEQMKWLLERMCEESGVDVRLHTRCAGALVEQGCLRGVITESKSGGEAFSGKVFIDATGDGDLSAQAGCAYDYGREGDGDGQPMSLIALVGGVKREEVARFVRGLAEPLGYDPKKELLEELKRAGIAPSYGAPSLFNMPGDLLCMMITHVYGVRGFDADDVTRATMDARKEVHAAVEALRALGAPWANLEIAATAEHIGVREGRRIRGRYTVSEEDLAQGRKHEDAICRVAFGVDVHSPDPDKGKDFDHGKTRAKPYDIPYRALLPLDVQGLLMAGRCISGDFIAHSSYRVTGNAVALGEAAGIGAALAVSEGRLPDEVPWEEMKKRLPS